LKEPEISEQAHQYAEDLFSAETGMLNSRIRYNNNMLSRITVYAQQNLRSHAYIPPLLLNVISFSKPHPLSSY
jgi:hypothetical protein